MSCISWQNIRIEKCSLMNFLAVGDLDRFSLQQYRSIFFCVEVISSTLVL